MYQDAELIVKLDAAEVQQALGIWLDDDAQQALNFIREKIVNKTVRHSCKGSADKKMAPCHLTKSNWACSWTGSP